MMVPEGAVGRIADGMAAAALLAELGLHESLLAPADAFKEDEFIALVLRSASADRVQGQLSQALRLINSELGLQVSTRYNSLIGNVQATQAVEAKLKRSSERLQTLVQTIRRVQAQSARPYSKLCSSTAQLERMHESTQLLRQTQRAMAQCKRLRDAMAPAQRAGPVRALGAAASPAAGGVGDVAPPASCSAAPTSPSALPVGAPARRADLSKAAAALCELEQIFAESDLSGIELVDAQLPFVNATSVAVRKQAAAMLRSGLEEHSQAQMGSALQIFYNLGELKEAAQSAAQEVAETVSQAIATALDPSLFGTEAAVRISGGGGVLGDLGAGSSGAARTGMPPASAAASWRASLWNKVDGMAEAFFAAACRIVELQRVLAKKRDPLTHTLFASLYEGEEGEGEEGEPEGDDSADPRRRQRPATRGGHAIGGATLSDGHRWAAADFSIFDGSTALASVVAVLPATARAGSSSALPASAVANAVSDQNQRGGLFAARPRGLLVLYAPLAHALRAATEKAIAGAPFVRATLTSELPRLLDVLLASSERAEQYLLPAQLPREAQIALGAEALLESLAPLRDARRRELSASLNAACNAQLSRLAAAEARRGHSSGDSGAGGAGHAGTSSSSPCSLGVAIRNELRSCDGLLPLHHGVVAAGAQAVALFAHQAEAIVFHSAPGVNSEVAADSDAKSAAANGALLGALQALRADVHQALDEETNEEVGAPMRSALALLNAPVAALANPSTPLPDELREVAARLLKVVLRREMIDARE